MSDSAALLMEAWLAGLKHERRMSPHTLRAYRDDAARFLTFLARHRGARVGLKALQSLRAGDVRAFITERRAEGLGARGVPRALAALRSFYRHLGREGLAEGAALRAVRSPKLPR